MTNFDSWLLKMAREKPKCQIYAHLQARAAMAENGVEGAKEAKIDPLEAIVEPRGRLKDNLENVEEVDFKLRAENDQDSWEDKGTPGFLGDWDGQEDADIIEEEENE